MSPPTSLRPAELQLRELSLHGHRLCYRIAGEGPVVLLIHGIAGDAESWRPVQELLAQRFTVIAPDLPGHGTSDKPAGDYSLGSLASTLRDLLVALGHERASIVGHSLGGGIAMQFSYQFPERSERLVLVSSGGLGPDVNLLLRAACLPGADQVVAVAAGPLVAVGGAVAGAMRRIGVRPAADLEVVARGFASLADTDTRTAFLSTLRSVVGFGGQRVDARDRLYLAAGMPTLLIWGERDPIIPVAHGRAAHELMPGSELVTFADAGHMPQVEDPRRFAQVLVEFIATTKPSNLTPQRWRKLLGDSIEPAPEPARARVG